MRKLLAAACLLSCGASAAAAWHEVPGAPAVSVDLGSVQLQQRRLVLWVRWWGRPPLLPEAPVPAARVHRTSLLTEFDCATRSVRVLAAQGDDGNGRPVFMSSVPGPVQPVRGEELEWTYDAVCELARTGS
jgi:hypothetical protein